MISVSRNREAICARRRITINDDPSIPSGSTTVSALLTQLHLHTGDFSAALGNKSPTEYLYSIYGTCIDYHDSGLPDSANHFLESKIKTFTSLQRDVTHLEGEILTMAGIGEVYTEASRICKAISTVLVWLEDLWCSNAEGDGALRNIYNNNGLLFQ